MSRQSHTYVVLLLIALTALTGCHPTQPFYFGEDGDLSHYLDQATDLEYPDVDTVRRAVKRLGGSRPTRIDLQES